MADDGEQGQPAGPVVPTAPSQVRVRAAVPADAAAIAACQAACWREAYAHLVPPRFFDAYPEGMGADRWRQVLAADGPVVAVAVDGHVGTGAAVVGFSCATPARQPDDAEPPPRPWQLSSIYLRAHLHGSGAGGQLLRSTLGRHPAFLWVFRDNPRAIAFYRRHGFVPDGTETTDGRWTGLREVRMVR